jgi:hypothetical protein
MSKLRVFFRPCELLHMLDFPFVLFKFLKITFPRNYIPVLESSEYFPDFGGRIPAIIVRTESIKLRRGSSYIHNLSVRKEENKNQLNSRLNEGAQRS